MREVVRVTCLVALGMLALGGILGVPAATASPTQLDVTGAVGRPTTLDGEQVHTVLQVQRWHGGNDFAPKPGDAVVTVRVTIRALKETSCNPLWYALEAQDGKSYGRVALGERAPALGASNHLLPGTASSGWLTFSLPIKPIVGPTLVYHMRAGFGPTLRVPLGHVPDGPSARLGQPLRLEGEQAQTASTVARLSSLGA